LLKYRNKKTWRQSWVGTTEIYILVVFSSLKLGFTHFKSKASHFLKWIEAKSSKATRWPAKDP